MNSVLAGLKTLGPLRLGAMAAVAAGVMALLAVLVLRDTSPPMALLYADLDLREAGQVVEQLDRARIPREIQAGGSRVLVPADQVARARLLLAKDGLPSGGSIGYEIFDRADGLTASGFQQGINQTRALEGELSRSIRMIQGVRAARVHLVLPRREPFARERQDAQASVVLTMTGAGRMDREGIQAVLNLTAAAVPGLRPQHIAVVDSRGNVLARAGEPLGPAAAQGADELRRSTEVRLARAVEEMLERSLGPGRVRAETAIDMDYDQVRETKEVFDPDGQVVRSQQSNTNNSRTTEASPTVSVQNNLPNADAGQAAGAGSQEQRQEETTNYEIGKTVRTLVREQPQLRRISVAVMVDGVVTRGADGAPVWREREAEELGRIAALVRSAVGFNEQRGDRVEIVSMRFAGAEEAAEATASGGLLGIGLEKTDLLRLGESGLIALVVVLGLLLVLRPLALRLTADPARLPATAGEAAGAAEAALAAAGAVPRLAASETDPDALAAIEDERMISVANVEGAMRASSIKRIASLAERNPEEAVSVMRNWLAQEMT